MPDRYWEGFTIGDTVDSRGITITEAHLVTWAGLTLDFYPLHMDAEYAAGTQFGRRIAHGPLTFAIAVGLMDRTGWAGDAAVAWLGVDNMRLPRPVFIGDTIRLHAEVTELAETKNPKQGFCKMLYTVLNQDDAEVMRFDMNFLMHRN
ncbi:MAG: MaoC/PaaZ C-terminal domain-containing protein [Acidimicrobiia bacterium]